MNKLTLWLASVAIVLAVATASISVLYSYQLHKRFNQLSDRFVDVAWEVASNKELSRLGDQILPSVGTIQFLKDGFSIQFTEVNYTQEGLQLAGYIGNPRNLWVGNLTCVFHAYKPLYSQQQENFLQPVPMFLWITPEEIGNAQSNRIVVLPPGQLGEFHAVIPNVVQTKGGFILTVTFTGAHYSFE